MLFHSSIRTELARSFGATLVVLFTIVLTVLLVRTLGLATSGSVNPEEVMLVLGYTVLGYTQIILTLALFISIVSTLSRMYRDSEMIIWLSSGRSLGGFISPVMRFAWPILLVIVLLALFVWPWANKQTAELRFRFENRSDLQRIAPGQFQESTSGRRVFFIDKDTAEGTEGRNVFISSIEKNGNETVTSATTGRIEWVGDRQFLMLNQGQRLENDPTTNQVKVSQFEQYGAQIGAATPYSASVLALKARSSLSLIKEPTPGGLGELGWRIGVALTAFNLVLLGIATTVSNPRAGRSGNLMFTLFAFVVYFNMLNIGQRWVTIGQVNWLMLMLFLHGSVFAMSALWLAKRHKNIHLRSLFLRSRDESPTEAAA
ncbi:LPS export ABC transporter permease LptF [Hydrogenophaga sp. RWCD_12]|uniref:LPS export ABC transporter permease LptF n=1 Tax=Hydrogenophaga sp. RWCD_12 TaxID=3391190 RepID=UPI003984D39E